MTLGAGTPVWMAPETVDGKYGKARYGLPADVYSFGITMWETLSRATPYADIDCPTRVLVNRIIDEGLRPTMPTTEAGPAWFEGLMRRCWDRDPTQRPTFRGLVEAFGNNAMAAPPAPRHIALNKSTGETTI